MKFDLSKIQFSNNDIRTNIILPKKMSLELAEEIGLHYGDGSMNIYSNKGFYQLRGHKDDDKEHYIDPISYLYKKLYNLDPSIRLMESTGVIGFQIWSNVLVEFKNKILGIPLGKKNDLQIPKILKTKEEICAFIRGFFDTDGCVYIETVRKKPYPRIELSTTSPLLCLQIKHFLENNNVSVCHYELKRQEIKWKNLHRLIVRGYPNLNSWMSLINTNNPKHKKKISLVVKWKNGGSAEI